MLGIITEPTAAASAMAAPETPAIIMFTITTTYDSPPRMLPTAASAKATSRRVIPPAFISSPAKMKNGTAIRMNESAPLTVICASTIG